MTIINQPRKIIVTACLNCPYHTTVEDVDARHRCRHPNFIGVHPIINSKHIENLTNTNSDMMHTPLMPDWCPLDLETRYYYTCNTTEI